MLEGPTASILDVQIPCAFDLFLVHRGAEQMCPVEVMLRMISQLGFSKHQFFFFYETYNFFLLVIGAE
jgi:hypothetical protein